MPPTMLLDSLEALRRKVKALSVAYGAGIVLAAGVGLLLVTVLLDYLLNLPAAPRIVVMVAAATTLGYALARWVIRPLVARLTVSDVAGRLEQAFPQFDDRLRSTVDFLRQDIPGSEMMKQRVISEASAMAQHVDLNRAVVATPVWYSLGSGIASLALLALLAIFIAGPQYTSIALSRLLNPFDAVSWPKRVQIDLLGSVPQRVPVGQRIDVRMRLARGDRETMRAVVFYRYGEGPVQQEYMARGGDGTYSASLDARLAPGTDLASLQIWMKSGDDERRLEPITVVPRLAIRSVEAHVTPPSYVTGAEPLRINLAHAPAMMALGSAVELHVAFNKPLAGGEQSIRMEPVVEQNPPQILWERGEHPHSVVGSFVAGESLRFRIRGTDTDSFQNSGLEEYEIVVRPDQKPIVQIEQPRRHEERTAVAVVPLQGVAEDDYGITSLKLMVERLGDSKQWELDLVQGDSASPGVAWQRTESSSDRVRYRAQYGWDLAQLPDANLRPGDVLEYYLQVTDNFNLNGETHAPAASGKLRISIISQDELANRAIEELRNIKGQIEGVLTNQNRTRDETVALAEETEDKPQLDAADRAVAERLTSQQSTAASQAKQLSGKLEAVQNRLEENKSPAKDLTELSRDVKRDMDRAAEGPMKQATDRISNASQPQQSPQQRQQSLEDAQSQQQQASDQLQQAIERMANIGSLQQTIDRIRQLLEDQQKLSQATAEAGKSNLGKKPEEMSQEDRDKLDKIADDQQKLADRTSKATDQMQELAEQMRQSDPSAAEAMERAAQTSKQQQVSSRQQNAAQQARQNQQASAQAQQRQAELGLEMILKDLREAERRRLAELQKQLAELEQQVAQLVRRQATHNLDNLQLQGAEALAALPVDTRDQLFALSGRDPQGPPGGQLPQLTTAQEQTERNTRDIAKATSAMPNAAEPAAHLTRAAGRMQRAIVHLRDSKLPDAYQPPQVEALVSLLEAQHRVAEMKQEVDDEIESQQKETIRQQYVKIKEQQERLNEETSRIDKTPRLDGGQLPRDAMIQLGQLPGRQGALADETTKLNEALEALESIVYVWANRDIVKTMNEVKASLAKPQTGTPTQAEQARIVSQLDAMIRNLATKPAQSKFAQDAGDGGGGGGQGQQGGARLPSEAELSLIKDLQIGVNTSTRQIDQAPDRDNAALVNLGNRQGDFRKLLDEVIQQASQGKMQLGPEPDQIDQLPEEANREDVENQELESMLLTDAPDAEQPTDKKVMLVGDRMARSRQRLAVMHDPGKTTQLIQERILEDLDLLIEEAREQQAQARNAQPRQGQAMQRARADQQAMAQNQGEQSKPSQSDSPAEQSTAPGAAARSEDLSKDIRETMQEWGQLSPRHREAVIEGTGEVIIEEYKRLVDDYYKSLATKATER